MVSFFVSRTLKILVFLLAFFAAVAVMSVLKATVPDGGSSGNGTRSADSLALVVVVSSHGNIGAATDYPDDPYPLTDSSYWPFGSSQLTPQGRVQMYSLGAQVRGLYHGFLSETYDPEDTVAASTPVDKVVISGQMFLAGLYPARDEQSWYRNVAWQPVPVYTNSPDNSATLLGGGCDAFTLATATGKAQFAATYATNVIAVTDHVNNATGSNMSGSSAVHALYAKLLSEDMEGYTEIPSWAKEIYPYKLQPLAGTESTMMFIDTPEMARLLIGELLAEVLGVMKTKTNGSSSQSLYYYSGHATTLLGLLTALGVPRSSLVSDVLPGSALLLELHRLTNSSQFNVQTFFIHGNASIVLDPVPVDLPECGDPCDFYTVVNITHNFTSSVNLSQECQISTTMTDIQTR